MQPAALSPTLSAGDSSVIVLHLIAIPLHLLAKSLGEES
jgi:hypothetical protein